jgi:predicted nucleic-acid-binding Zn-ribbon protein
MENLNITKIKSIGQGGQGATVWKVKIEGLEGLYADKIFELDNNSYLAEKCLRSSYAEFVMGQDLFHPNIA